MNVLDQFKNYLKSQGLTDEQVEAIAKGLAPAKIYLTAEEKLEERYTKLKGQKELLDEQLKTANSTIETLKKDNGSNEDLQAEVKKYKDGMADLQAKYDRDVTTIEKRIQVIAALEKEGAINPDLLVNSIDLSKVELKDGKISGHTDSIKDLKKNYTNQFKEKDNDPEGDDGKGGAYVYTPAGTKVVENAPADIIGAMSAYSVHK